MGLDLAPLKNAFQGLACLGSKKRVEDKGSSLLGMMRLGREEGCGGGSDCGFNVCEWVPDYTSTTHPLLMLTESSVIMPGPRCIGLNAMSAWRPSSSSYDASQGAVGGSEGCGSSNAQHLRGEGVERGRECQSLGDQGLDESDSTLEETLRRVLIEERAAMQDLLLRVQAASLGDAGGKGQFAFTPGIVCGSTYARGMFCGGAMLGRKQGGIIVNRGLGEAAAAGGGVCRKRLVECEGATNSLQDALSEVPEWFAACVAGIYKECGDGYEKAFRTANMNIQNISKPSIIPSSSSSSANDCKCKVIHLTRTEICLCTLNLMEIPFKVCACVLWICARACICVRTCVHDSQASTA
jgi:hypothetical protein